MRSLFFVLCFVLLLVQASSTWPSILLCNNQNKKSFRKLLSFCLFSPVPVSDMNSIHTYIEPLVCVIQGSSFWSHKTGGSKLGPQGRPNETGRIDV